MWQRQSSLVVAAMLDSGSNGVQVAATDDKVEETAEREQRVAFCLWMLFCVEKLWV